MSTIRWAATALMVGAASVITAGCGGPSSPPVAAPCVQGSGVSGHATTKSYVMQLDIGLVETMYTPDQVASQHPTSGEVMLGGQMSSTGGSMPGMAGMGDMPGMSGSASPSDHHLEAHICSKATGAPVQNANPKITVVDDATKNITVDVPIAVMQGVGSGVSDYHYGNNVVLMPGSSYSVLISLNGETARFHIQMPASGT